MPLGRRVLPVGPLSFDTAPRHGPASGAQDAVFEPVVDAAWSELIFEPPLRPGAPLPSQERGAPLGVPA